MMYLLLVPSMDLSHHFGDKEKLKLQFIIE